MSNKASTLSSLASQRFSVKGKFLFCGENKFYIKGVTYGTFRPAINGTQFPSPEAIENDFAQMVQNGINAVRTYTVPPEYVLDIALKHNLKVMVGLPWEQHITFLDSSERRIHIIEGIRAAVRACGCHPALLCFTIGNEIPAPIVRWYGNMKIENFILRLYKAVKAENPDVLVTYINYPTTEYLDLHFLDFACFNVFLEEREKLDAYLQHLLNITIDKPLVLAEIGLDSMRNGLEKQAETLEWQLDTVFSKGCAGAFVFAWTDEWWRGGFDVLDWDFGLVDRNRKGKPALQSVSKVFARIPIPGMEKLPYISVLVCSRNGGSTIRDTMEGLLKIDYPSYEVIVVNDGSTDNLPEIVMEYPFRLINTPNRGLSSARNTAMLNARGEIVAYIDDDAYPDPQWLRYLAYAYHSSTHAAIGGPNIAPDDDGPIATCVAHAPGGPVHVLVTDEIAEHIPGCNMSFRRDVLLEVGGFDPVYRQAGDDVDICWRIQLTGRTIGFHPSAFVWHHRRNSLKAYWKQQKGYGKAEALLEAKWPEKYNNVGHLSWIGKIYGNGISLPLKLKKDKVFHGVWGSAPFQSLYQQSPEFISYIPLMPEWYLLIYSLALLSVFGIFWNPLLWLIPAFFLALAILVTQAGFSAFESLKAKKFKTRKNYLKYFGLTTLLHIVQPFARLYGRIAHGLSPWRTRGSGKYKFNLLFKRNLTMTFWSEKWKALETYLQEIEYNLIKGKARVRRGGQFDRWDLQVSSGLFSIVRGLITVEEHGSGKQLLRFKCRSHFSGTGFILTTCMAIISFLAILDESYVAGSIIGFMAIAIVISFYINKARAMYDFFIAFHTLTDSETIFFQVAENTSKNEDEIPEDGLQFIPVSVGVKINKDLPPKRDDIRQKRLLESLSSDD
jgi:glycosyltransferase involved in cell wall biosynthesis